MRPQPVAPRIPSHRAGPLGPAAPPALERFRSPELPTTANNITVPFALLPSLRPGAKPCGYASLRALAQRIHRERRGDALELKPAQVRFRDHPRDVTEVLARNEASGETRRIGFAWAAGKDWTALQAALAAVAPTASVEG